MRSEQKECQYGYFSRQDRFGIPFRHALFTSIVAQKAIEETQVNAL